MSNAGIPRRTATTPVYRAGSSSRGANGNSTTYGTPKATAMARDRAMTAAPPIFA
jgi:hypothetical protein